MKHLHDSCSPQQELVRISNFLHSSMFGNIFGTVGLGHKLVPAIAQARREMHHPFESLLVVIQMDDR